MVEYYNCKSCSYGRKPVLMANKSAVAVLADPAISPVNDSYVDASVIIVYPRRHIKQREFSNEENELFGKLFGRAVKLMGKNTNTDITTIGCHQLGKDAERKSWQIVYDTGHTPTGHYFQKLFFARKPDLDELEALIEKLKEKI